MDRDGNRAYETRLCLVAVGLENRNAPLPSPGETVHRGWRRQKHQFPSATNPFYAACSRTIAAHHSINMEDSIRKRGGKKDTHPGRNRGAPLNKPIYPSRKGKERVKKLGGRRQWLFPSPISCFRSEHIPTAPPKLASICRSPPRLPKGAWKAADSGLGPVPKPVRAQRAELICLPVQWFNCRGIAAAVHAC